jgi:hypothetical protein
MSVHRLKTKDDSAAHSDYPRLRATATEFVPDSDKLYPLRIAEGKSDPFCPLVVTSPAFPSVRKWIENQSHYQIAHSQPLASTAPSRSRRTRRRQHQRSRNMQGHTAWYYTPVHQPLVRPQNEAVLLLYHDNDAPLHGITAPILQAADPFHEQVDEINEQLVLFNRNDDDSDTCQIIHHTP